MSNHAVEPPAWLTVDYIQNVLRKSLKDPNLIVENFSTSPGSKVGDNYACQILQMTLDLNQNGKKTQKHIIGKFKPPTKTVEALDKIENFNFHRTENDFLTDILPKIHKRLNNLGIKKSIGPKVLYTDIKNSVIFMEDLKVQGFVLVAKLRTLTLDECLLTVDSLATLHATSYLLIRDDPTITKPYGFCVWKQDLGVIKAIIDYSMSIIEQGAKHWDNILTPSQLEKVLKLRSQVDRTAFALAEPQHDSYLKVLLHGDCWKSNMMFRYVNDKPQEVCMFDFQIVQYNCFANDLQYFMATSAETDVIINETDTLLQRYWESFNEIAPNVLTFEKVKETYESRYYLGYLWFLLIRSGILAEGSPDLGDILMGEEVEVMRISSLYTEQVARMIPFYERKGVI